MLTEEIKEKHFQKTGYIHLDRRRSFEEVENYVTDSNKVANHSFLPLLHYISETEKFTGIPNPKHNNRPIEIKKRDIKYAGHLDNYIYKYFSLCLNNKYNEYLKMKNIDECSTAYRNNKPKKSNIDFAAEVINYIAISDGAFIFVGDFTDFFGSLDHQQLKGKLIEVIGGKLLNDDWYNIFRSLTKYGYYSKDDIEKFCGTESELRQKGQFSYFKTVQEFRAYQKDNKPKYNCNKYGIPQGTAISGVFANVYAIDFDLEMYNIASRYNGIYRRYSDDFILVIPKQNLDIEPQSINQIISDLAEENKINLQPDKTHTYRYGGQEIIDIEKSENSYLDYLGFIFDGKIVKIRPKSPYKFYRKAKKLIRKAHATKRKKGLEYLPYRKRIYRLYTDLGVKPRHKNPHGNFIAYVKRSQRIFDKNSPHTKNIMLQQIKNRKKKIERELGYRLHVRLD